MLDSVQSTTASASTPFNIQYNHDEDEGIEKIKKATGLWAVPAASSLCKGTESRLHIFVVSSNSKLLLLLTLPTNKLNNSGLTKFES